MKNWQKQAPIVLYGNLNIHGTLKWTKLLRVLSRKGKDKYLTNFALG